MASRPGLRALYRGGRRAPRYSVDNATAATRNPATPLPYPDRHRLPLHRLPADPVGAIMGGIPLTIDERLRLNIHNKLTELLGSEEADALMSRMIPVPWHDVATKDDLQLMRSDLDVLRAEFRAEMAELRTDLRAEIHDAIVGQTRWVTGYITALSIVMLAVARLLFQ